MKNFNELKVNMNLSIGFVQDRRESEPLSNFIDEDSWNKMNKLEMEQFINECIKDWAFNYIEYGGSLE